MPRKLLTTLCLLVFAACGAPDAWLLVAADGPAVARIPVVESDEPSRTAVLDADAMLALGYRGMWNGMSGAPLLRDGKCVGYLRWTRSRSVLPTRCLGYVPATEVDDWAARADAWSSGLEALEEPVVPLALPPDVALAGSLAATAFVWGDIVSGPCGTVCRRAGDLVWMYGHPVLRAGWPGQTNLAFVTARPLGLTRTLPTISADMNFGVVAEAGWVRWAGTHGMLAELGRRCPSVEVTVRGSMRWWRGESAATGLQLFAARQAHDVVDFSLQPVIAAVRGRAMSCAELPVFDVELSASLDEVEQRPGCTLAELEQELQLAISSRSPTRRIVVALNHARCVESGAVWRPASVLSGLVQRLPRQAGRLIGSSRLGCTEAGRFVLESALGREGAAAVGSWLVGCVLEDGRECYLVEHFLGVRDDDPSQGLFECRRIADDAPHVADQPSRLALRIGSVSGEFGVNRAARLIWQDETLAVAMLQQAPFSGAIDVPTGLLAWMSAERDADQSKPPREFEALAPVATAERFGQVVAVDVPYVVIARDRVDQATVCRMEWRVSGVGSGPLTFASECVDGAWSSDYGDLERHVRHVIEALGIGAQRVSFVVAPPVDTRVGAPRTPVEADLVSRLVEALRSWHAAAPATAKRCEVLIQVEAR